jgi:hypothetical protein
MFNQVYSKNYESKILAKRIYFAVTRAYHEMSVYRGPQLSTDREISVLHVGHKNRGRDFIERLFGYLPERMIIGKCFAWSIPKRINQIEKKFDFVMVEISRLFAQNFRQAGYFTIPQWVEFGRKIIKNPQERYAGAPKSLKSDLNKIRRSDLRAFISRDLNDFNFFYDRMYRPHILRRYADTMITKGRKQLAKIFSSGFLLILKKADQPVAGALVKIDDDVITESCIGVFDGRKELLHCGVSGLMDYHLQEWAAENSKRFINLGHTRPFPLDGVYFNKRKWMMSISPDGDGVMSLAFKPYVRPNEAAAILTSYPFIFQSKNTLFCLVCICCKIKDFSMDLIHGLWKRYWTDGLKCIVVFAPAGFSPAVVQSVYQRYEGKICLTTNLSETLKFHG